MTNRTKGKIATVIGILIMAISVVYFFGFINLPNPDMINTATETGIAFGVGFVLFAVPFNRLSKAGEIFVWKKANGDGKI